MSGPGLSVLYALISIVLNPFNRQGNWVSELNNLPKFIQLISKSDLKILVSLIPKSGPWIVLIHVLIILRTITAKFSIQVLCLQHSMSYYDGLRVRNMHMGYITSTAPMGSLQYDVSSFTEIQCDWDTNMELFPLAH